MLITTTLGDRDDATLLKTEGGHENDTEIVTWVEYCRLGCPGRAHQTGQPDAAGLFCQAHIHRSVAMHLKRGVFADGVAGGVG